MGVSEMAAEVVVAQMVAVEAAVAHCSVGLEGSRAAVAARVSRAAAVGMTVVVVPEEERVAAVVAYGWVVESVERLEEVNTVVTEEGVVAVEKAAETTVATGVVATADAADEAGSVEAAEAAEAAVTPEVAREVAREAVGAARRRSSHHRCPRHRLRWTVRS